MRLGIEKLVHDSQLQKNIEGNIGVLCHAASIDKNFVHTIDHLKNIYGKRLTKIFGPQHGLVCDVQDNMIETDHFHHPHYDLPVYSLYGEYRRPTEEMLKGIDTLIIDLQDVGTRVYTYITTMSYCIEECAKYGIKIVILDRPNPVGGNLVEGNILNEKYKSFVGHHPIPMRHGLTVGEVGKLQQKFFTPNSNLIIISMDDWKRDMSWNDTKRAWVNPSPNLSTPNSALSFCGTVLFEGTNISEGRGTTRALEVVGAPKINPYSFCQHLIERYSDQLKGITLRPLYFFPMFQKHQQTSCGGIHLHITDPSQAKTWTLGQILIKEFYHQNDFAFQWNDQKYEYETENLAIDYINGCDSLRLWAEGNHGLDDLKEIENKKRSQFQDLRDNILIYSN